jgi:hypothetical protein
MACAIELAGDEYPTNARYEWSAQCSACHVAATVGSLSHDAEHEFVAEHYFAYGRRGKWTTEYKVEHRPWNLHRVDVVACDLNAIAVYGNAIGQWLRVTPCSALFADGSDVAVYPGQRLIDVKSSGSPAPARYFAPCS